MKFIHREKAKGSTPESAVNNGPSPAARALRTSLLLAGLLLSLTAATASPENRKEALDQIRLLSGILQEMPERMELQFLDLFESKRDYYTRAPSTDLSVIDYAYRSPEGEEFKEEMDLLQKVDPAASYHRCLLIHTSFDVPGKQVYQVLLRHPVPMRGEPVRLSVWIHAQNQKHGLSALFTDPRGRPVEVPLGALTWKGWKRISVNLPGRQFRSQRDRRIPAGGTFRGFLIRSHPLEDAGPVSVMIDNLTVLKDMQKILYPGAEINDTWGDR